MKFLFTFLLLALLVAASKAAIVATNLIPTATLTGAATNTSGSYTVPAVLTVSAQTIWVTHGSLGTNVARLSGAFQVSFDSGSNWSTVATFTPTTTNATTEAYTPSVSALQPVSRFVITSTNTVTNVSVTVGYSN